MDISQCCINLPQFNLTPLVGDKRIVLYVQQQRGQGDLANGYRMAEALVNRGNIDPKKIIIATNDVEGMTAFNKLKIEVIDKSKANKIQDVALQIIVPGFWHAFNQIILNAPILQLEEYGFGSGLNILNGSRVRGVSKGMGFDKKYNGEVGIWINSKVMQSSLTKLQGLSPNFENFLVGINKDAFFTNNKLYLGYASEKAYELTLAYVQSIIELNKENEFSLTIVLPQVTKGLFEKPEYLLHPEKREPFKAKKLDNFKNHGIGLFVYKVFSETPTQEEIVLGQSAKKLTVIGGKITPEDMLILWRDSEREVLATGDQSASEVVSANKSIVYEVLPHKRSFATPFWMAYNQKILTAESTWKESNVITEFYRKNQKDNYKELTEVNSIVVQVFDCFPGVVGGMIEALKTNNGIVDFREKSEMLTTEQIPFKAMCVALKKDIQEKLQIVDFGWQSVSPILSFAGSAFSFTDYDENSVSFERVVHNPLKPT